MPCSEEDVNLLAGHLLQVNVPDRNNKSHLFLSRSEYPADTFPEYLAGGAYLMSRPVLERLRVASRFVRRIPIEDIYVGMVTMLFFRERNRSK